MTLAVPRIRLLTVPVIVALVLVALPATAPASVPQIVICIETGLLPPIGNCPQQPPAPPAPEPQPPAAEPEPPAEKPKKKPKKTKGCRDASLEPTSRNAARIQRATLCLLNKERRKRGRKALRTHPSLASTAKRYGTTMVDEEFFDHVSPSGSTLRSRVRRTAYLKSKRIRRWTIGENLAWGTGTRATPAQIVRSWMGSPGHKRNILDRGFRDIGVGIVTGVPETPSGTQGGATYVTVFGVRVHR
jgi:uncharacterized protein YkwD